MVPCSVNLLGFCKRRRGVDEPARQKSLFLFGVKVECTDLTEDPGDIFRQLFVPGRSDHEPPGGAERASEGASERTEVTAGSSGSAAMTWDDSKLSWAQE